MSNYFNQLAFRTENAIAQLQRYGRAAEHERIVTALELLSNVNDDMAHGRHWELIVEGINKVTAELNELAKEVRE